jgi:hypothetical protein
VGPQLRLTLARAQAADHVCFADVLFQDVGAALLDGLRQSDYDLQINLLFANFKLSLCMQARCPGLASPATGKSP